VEFENIAGGWEIWSVEERRAVLAYRPDVFDSDAYPAPCLPTIYVTKGRRGRRPGRPTPPPDAPWYVTLYLEPEVSDTDKRYESREQAREGALALAERFATGEVEYRALYQVPRPAYLDKLDELTER